MRLLIFALLTGLVLANLHIENEILVELTDFFVHFFLGGCAELCAQYSICKFLILFPVTLLVCFSVLYNWKNIGGYILKYPLYVLANILIFFMGMKAMVKKK
jgi:hypothetical protein